jgi:hypothetical protein
MILELWVNLRNCRFHLTGSLFRLFVLMIVENQEVRIWGSTIFVPSFVKIGQMVQLTYRRSEHGYLIPLNVSVESSQEPAMSVVVSDVSETFCHRHQGLVWWVVRLRFRIRLRFRLRMDCFRPLDRPVLSVPAASYVVMICSTVTARVTAPPSPLLLLGVDLFFKSGPWVMG